MLGPDYMDTLTKFIHPDHIPRYLGGNCACDGDPECRSKITPGGQVPASMRAGLPATSVSVDVKHGHADVTSLPVEAGTKVSWQFKVAANDVNFFAFFSPATVDVATLELKSTIPYGHKVIIAPHRTAAEAGEFVASAEGHVTLVWDNSFSWFHNKTVMKQVDLVEPEHVTAAAVASASTPTSPSAGIAPVEGGGDAAATVDGK